MALRLIAEEPFDPKATSAFYTPATIADYLTEWAIASRSDATVLDPSCGEGVFLRAAGRLPAQDFSMPLLD